MKVLLQLLLFSSFLWALTGEEILEKMDDNRDFESISYSGIMTIYVGTQKRVKRLEAVALVSKESKAFVEFTNPEDEGTRYLMLDDNLWIYFPDEDDVVKISGHLLKEGMMGSDVSYEDALESDKLSERYNITLSGDTTINSRECYKILLKAKIKKVPYDKREMIVDKESFVCWSEKMYAKSGKLLKEANILEVQKIDQRTIPTKTEMVNKLRKNSKTIFEMTNIKFNIPLDKSQFSMRYLRR